MTARTDGILQQALNKNWQDYFTSYTDIELNNATDRFLRGRFQSGRGRFKVVMRYFSPAPAPGYDPYYEMEFFVNGGWSGNPQKDNTYAMFFPGSAIISSDGLATLAVAQIQNDGTTVVQSPFTGGPVPPYNTRLQVGFTAGVALTIDLDFFPLDLVTPPNPFPPKYTIHEDTDSFPAGARLELLVTQATSTTLSGYIPLGNGHGSYATDFGWREKRLSLTDTDLALNNFNPYDIGLGRIRVNLKHVFATPPAGADPFYEVQFDVDGGYFARKGQGGTPGRFGFWFVKDNIPGASVFSTDATTTVVRDPVDATLFTVTTSALDGSNVYSLLFQPLIDPNNPVAPRFGITRTAGTFAVGDTLEVTFTFFNP